MVNVDRCRQLADAIERGEVMFGDHKVGFSMRVELLLADDPFICGSSACVAGWSGILFRPAQIDEEGELEIPDAVTSRPWLLAMQVDLDITERQAEAIYWGSADTVGCRITEQSRPAAVEMLRRLADTGEVRW